MGGIMGSRELNEALDVTQGRFVTAWDWQSLPEVIPGSGLE
jgi:hypothetical protein